MKGTRSKAASRPIGSAKGPSGTSSACSVSRGLLLSLLHSQPALLSDGDIEDEVMSGEESGDVQMETTQRRRVEPGEPAPDFRLPSTQGTDVALSEFRGRKHVVLAFLRGMT